jgi:hypothetical protein
VGRTPNFLQFPPRREPAFIAARGRPDSPQFRRRFGHNLQKFLADSSPSASMVRMATSTSASRTASRSPMCASSTQLRPTARSGRIISAPRWCSPVRPRLPRRARTRLRSHTRLDERRPLQVLRRLAQDVPGWWAQMEQAQGKNIHGGQDRLAAKVVGRWCSGSPLALAPDYDDPSTRVPKRINKFGFGDDPEGENTPIFAHIRKTYPRGGRSTTICTASCAEVSRSDCISTPPWAGVTARMPSVV